MFEHIKEEQGEPAVFFDSDFFPLIGLSREDYFSIPLCSIPESKYG